MRIESDGGDHTVNRGKTQGGKSEQPFAHTDGGAFRAVYDLADLGNSRFMIATGQSGNFLSRHYSDLLAHDENQAAPEYADASIVGYE